MTVVTLRPNGTVGTSMTLVGAATAHAALSDNLDTSYVEANSLGETTTVDLDAFTQPAGSVIRGVRARVRLAKAVAGGSINLYLRRATSGGPVIFNQYFNGFSSTTLTELVTTEDTEGAAGSWTDAELDSWMFQLTHNGFSGGDSVLRFYEAYLDVVCVEKPVVSADAPSGVIVTNLPLVQWTNTLDADGGSQTTYAAKVFTQAQYTAGGFDPATTVPFAGGEFSGGTTSYQVTTPLPDGIYRAYVRVGQTVNGSPHLSDYDFTEFTVGGDLPGTPTLVATADNANARIALAITDVPGDANTDRFEIERSLDGGATWEPIRTVDDGGIDVPFVVAVGELADTADSTTHNVPLPAPPGGIQPDDLLIGVTGMDGNPTITWPSGWTEIKDEAGNGSAVRAGVAWKRADGGETGTVAVTTSVAEGGGTRILCVRGAHTETAPEVSTGVSSAAANANPDALNPAGWGTEPTLWIAAMVLDGNVAVTAGPANYFNFGNTRWANAAGAGVATAELLSVAASADPGAFTHAAEDSRAFTIAVRPRNPNLTAWDYEAPNGTTVQYRARALHDYNGEWAVSAWSAVDSEAWSSTSWWLKHPHRPDLNMVVVVRAIPEIHQAARRGVFQALGAARPIVVSDTRGAEEGEVVLRFLSAADQTAFRELYDTAETVLLQSPIGQGGPDYVALGDRSRRRIVEQVADASRVWETAGFVIVDSPLGDVVSWP